MVHVLLVILKIIGILLLADVYKRQVLYDFKRRYPQIRVEITEANSMALEQLLIDGRLDLGLVALPLTKLKSDVRFLMRDEIYICAAQGHPVMEYARETERDLSLIHI